MEADSTAWESPQTRQHAATVLAPLGEEEARRATDAALEVVTSEDGVSAERLRVYPPRVRVEKPPSRDEAPVRSVWVRVRDRDRRSVHEVFVEDGRVAEHVVRSDVSPPFSDEEREEARRLLAGDDEVGALLRGDDVEVRWFVPGHGPERLLGAALVRVADGQVVEEVGRFVVDVDAPARVAWEGGGRHG